MDPETSFYRLKEDMKKKWFKDSRDKVVITSYSEFVQNFYDDFKKSSIPRTSCSLEDSKRLRIEKLLSKHSRDPKDHVVAEELEEYAPEVLLIEPHVWDTKGTLEHDCVSPHTTCWPSQLHR